MPYSHSESAEIRAGEASNKLDALIEFKGQLVLDLKQSVLAKYPSISRTELDKAASYLSDALDDLFYRTAGEFIKTMNEFDGGASSYPRDNKADYREAL